MTPNRFRLTTARAFSGFVAVAFLLTALAAFAQVKERPIPRIVKKDGRFALLVDDAPYFMLAAQVNNSSGWPAMLPQVWSAMEFLHANTVEIPVYWEQFEPRQGQFDYRAVDTLLAQARAHRMRLVLLWFGTWKNGNPHYVPPRTDAKRNRHEKSHRAVGRFVLRDGHRRCPARAEPIPG